MEIRRKLAFQFTLIVALILITAEISVYIFSSFFWKEDFYNRLSSKAMAVAKLLVDVEGVDISQLKLIELNNISLLPYEEIVVFNYKNEKIFASKDSVHLAIPASLIDRVKIERKVPLKQGKYTVLGLLYAGRYDRIVVIAGAIDVYGIRKLTTLRNILVFVFLAGLILVYASGKIYANRALNPILDVISQVTEINEKSLHLRVDEGNGKDEIARLAKTFNQMLDRLETAFKAQKNFIANASHELRTPLSYILGQLEVSVQRDRANEEYRRTILSVIDDLHQLNQSTNKLLLLASASADSQELAFHRIRIDEVIWEAREEVLKEGKKNKVSVRFHSMDENLPELEVFANEQLLKVAFTNIIENGCKYSEDHSVFIGIGKEGDDLLVSIADSGIGIPANELELIFEPFYRTRNGHSYKGHGLGLSLAQQIILLHNGTITVKSVVNAGSEFTVRLPLFKTFQA